MKKLILYLILSIMLLGCSGKDQPNDQGIYQVNWVEITSPPGIEGPCYAFFSGDSKSGYRGYGYSGVWCKQ